MTLTPPASPLLEEDEIRPLRERIEQIDRILEGPVRTLIRQAKEAEETAKTTQFVDPPRFRLWLASEPVPHRWPNALTTSLCLVTLHRLHRMGRRFRKLRKECEDLKPTLERLRRGYLPQGSHDARYFAACSHFVDSRTFGFLNPFSSAQVFRLLMETGEDHAHTGVGCITFFAMVWPLYHERRTDTKKRDGTTPSSEPRRKHDPLDVGARIEPYHATAYVTAKCLLPLIELRDICLHRARLFSQLEEDLSLLDAHRADAEASSLSHWTFCARAESLCRHLRAMAEVSIAKKAFDECSDAIDAPLQRLAHRSDVTALVETAVRELAKAMAAVAQGSGTLLVDAEFILTMLDRKVLKWLRKGKVPKLEVKVETAEGRRAKHRRTFGFDRPDDELPEDFPKYLQDLAMSGTRARDLCQMILDQLKVASGLKMPELPEALDAAALEEAIRGLRDVLKQMAAVNVEVAQLVSGPVDLHTRWCHTELNRHIAFATSGNLTDFDASELVSALAVGVRNQDLLSEAQVRNALEKAVVGLERDGSWRPPHPYFSSDGLQALRAPAADVVWTLVSALARFPRIRVADDALFSFVDWLERTQREIRPQTVGAGTPSDFGWAADQMRGHGQRIELFTTAYAVNALLAVRDLVEHRLWELCEERFTVVKEALPLEKMAAVDLFLPHGHRLHSQLSRMIRETRQGKDGAVYSMVLHGPPGSSKTTVASALSHSGAGSSGWGTGHRLVRVTPADFTRLGEDRVDAQAHSIFELLRHVRGITILFDEIDDLLRRRTGDHPRFLDLVIPAMLNRLQDLHDACEQQETCFLFGTNYVERIEPALMRRGRIDKILAVPYPDLESRCAIAEGELSLEQTCPDCDRAAWKLALREVARTIAEQTAGWSWSGVRLLAKNVRQRIEDGVEAHRTGGTPITPGEVIPNPDALVREEVTRDPPQLAADTIYQDRDPGKGKDSPELRTEVLRHALTFCTRTGGTELHHQLVEQTRRIAKWMDPLGDDIPTPTFADEAERLLLRLGLSNGAAGWASVPD